MPFSTCDATYWGYALGAIFLGLTVFNLRSIDLGERSTATFNPLAMRAIGTVFIAVGVWAAVSQLRCPLPHLDPRTLIAPLRVKDLWQALALDLGAVVALALFYRWREHYWIQPRVLLTFFVSTLMSTQIGVDGRWFWILTVTLIIGHALERRLSSSATGN